MNVKARIWILLRDLTRRRIVLWWEENHEAVDGNAEADPSEDRPQLEKLGEVENDRPDDDSGDVVPESGWEGKSIKDLYLFIYCAFS